MTLYDTVMQNEKIAIIALVIIIFGALSIFLVATYNEEILNNLFPEEKTIEFGDCADVNYIGTLTDGTLFDSSYAFPDNKTDGTPLKIFVTMNESETSPTEYPLYSSGLIEGFMEGLVGLKEGETATIGPISPEKAYGNKLKVGDTFTTNMLAMGTNINVELTDYTEENLEVKWFDPEDIEEFTSPQMIIMDFDKLETDPSGAITVPPPGLIWENATTIATINNDTCEVLITPTLSEKINKDFTPVFDQDGISTNIPHYYILPNETTATWDNTTITLESSPELGTEYSFIQSIYGTEYITIFTVVNTTGENINFSLAPYGEEVNESDLTYVEVNKTWTFNRTYTINRYYNIPLPFIGYYQMDIENAGYSVHEFAGEELTFEVTIEKVYKTSQES